MSKYDKMMLVGAIHFDRYLVVFTLEQLIIVPPIERLEGPVDQRSIKIPLTDIYGKTLIWQVRILSFLSKAYS